MRFATEVPVTSMPPASGGKPMISADQRTVLVARHSSGTLWCAKRARHRERLVEHAMSESPDFVPVLGVEAMVDVACHEERFPCRREDRAT